MDIKSVLSFKLIFDEKLENLIIKSDYVRLKQVLNNLLDNALKYTRIGGVEFGCIIENGIDLHFYVKDTGIGIPVEKQTVVFDSFRQVDDDLTTREYGGTGLGLSISKVIVETLNGKIWLESKVAVGTTFHFTIPFGQLEKMAEEKRESGIVSDTSN